MFGLYNPRWYPESIRLISREITESSNIKSNSFEESFLKKMNLSSNGFSSDINLAGKCIDLKELKKIWVKFQKDKYDPEVLNLSVRFHWILEELSKNKDINQAKFFLEIIDEWIKESNLKNLIISQPYNLSERIFNLCIFISICNQSHLIDEDKKYFYKAFINEELFKLKNSLEYPASGFVNNHILNNARALIMGGFFTGEKKYVNLGKEIYKLHLPEMISKSGYLKEGSSHYNLLLTKNLIEVFIISEKLNDVEFSEFLKSFAIKIFFASERLLSLGSNRKYSYPTIGDISPDMPENWFNLKEESSQGWHQLWDLGLLFKKDKIYQIKADKDEDWIIMENGKWKTLYFSHNNKNSYPFMHGHEDFGSFLLYYEGIEFLTDIGRYSYDNVSKKGINGIEQNAHSTIIFKKKKDNLIKNFFKGINFFKDSTLRIIFRHKNFILWRLKTNRVFWERKIYFEKNDNFCIEDSIESNYSMGFFYFSDNCQSIILEKDIIQLEIENIGEFIIKFKGLKNLKIEEIDFFPAYGTTRKTMRASWQRVSNKLEEKSLIEIKKRKNV